MKPPNNRHTWDPVLRREAEAILFSTKVLLDCPERFVLFQSVLYWMEVPLYESLTACYYKAVIVPVGFNLWKQKNISLLQDPEWTRFPDTYFPTFFAGARCLNMGGAPSCSFPDGLQCEPDIRCVVQPLCQQQTS